MATKLILKKSSVSGNEPTTSDLDVGEVAINLADKVIYSRDGNNNIIKIGDTVNQRLPIKADVALSAGNVLYATGAVGNSGVITVSKFISNNTIDELYVIGVAEEDMSLGDTGYALTQGEIKGITTDGSDVSETWTDGTVLYASASTAGALTSTAPTSPNQSIPVAMVIHAHASNGILAVRPTTGFHLNELHDVYAPSPSDGEALTWNASTSRWEASAVSSGGSSSYLVKTANYTALSGDKIVADTSGGSWTLTLPASPSAGDSVIVSDGADWATNNLTVARNGSTIEGDAEDMTMDLGNVSATFVYDGTTWEVYAQVGVSNGVSFLSYNYTATSGQTTFSGADDNAATLSYTPQNLIVTLNGVVLEDGTDYTANNGTSIVLTVAAASNDELNVIAFKPFTTADMVPASTGGTFSGNVNFAGAFTSQGIDDNATSTTMTLNSSGNVGIGTTSPSSKLHVNGTVTATAFSGNGSGLTGINAGGLEFIATADASNSATLDFTAFDATKYDSYLFALANVVPPNDNIAFYMRTSSNGGSTYDAGGGTYRSIAWYINTNAATGSYGATNGFLLANGVGSATGEDGVSGQVWVHAPHLITDYTHVNFSIYYNNYQFYGISLNGGGDRMSAADVDAVRFQFSYGNIESGTITMYGLKNA